MGEPRDNGPDIHAQIEAGAMAESQPDPVGFRARLLEGFASQTARSQLRRPVLQDAECEPTVIAAFRIEPRASPQVFQQQFLVGGHPSRRA